MCVGASGCRTTWATTCMAAKPMTARIHAHTGMMLTSAVNPTLVSFFSSIAVPLTRFLGVPAVRQVRTAEKQDNTHQQHRDYPVERESHLPQEPREAGMGPDPIERPPDQGSGDG